MKSRILTCITAMSLFAALAIPARMAAQHTRYIVTDLGTLGGTFSMAFFTNNEGSVGGTASLPDGREHGFVWRKGRMKDLGTLGGPNSIAFGAPNERGQAVGEAEISTLDPNGEDYCGFGTHLICLPFLWQDGTMIPLPTLGGNNGEANWVNARGEVAGSAENATPDSICPVPQVLHFEPVIWEKGQIQELPTFAGDPDGIAFGINDNVQVVGASGDCASFSPDTLTSLLPLHALLWQKGTVTNLGNLGGRFGNLAFAVNNQGQVVGVSDLPGDTTEHGFLWQNSVMTDLGTLPGDVVSVALGINDRSEVVGVSLDASGNLRPFLRQNGVMTDLNTLISADSPLLLVFAESINSRGEIAGTAMQKSTGDLHAFLATPINSEADNESATLAAPGGVSERQKVVLPENIRKMLQQRLSHRYHIPALEATKD